MQEIVVDANTNDYRVNLHVFAGPMDLLLYLIKKEEVDIYDIPISRITQQYLQYLNMMRTLDLEVAGEFILMAATLIHIKARLLLPRDENEPVEEDPREELIMALLEYKKYKEASDILRDKALTEEQTYVPPALVHQVEGKVEMSPATTLYDLLSAFKEVLAQQRNETIHEVVPEEITIEERIKVVIASLQEKEWATFTELFEAVSKRIMAVVTFIAILELARTRRIRIMQSQPFAELRIYRGEYYDAPQRNIDLVDPIEALERAEVK